MASYIFTYDPNRTTIPHDRVCFLCEGENPDMICERQPDEKHPEVMIAYAHDVCIATAFAEAHTKIRTIIINDAELPQAEKTIYHIGQKVRINDTAFADSPNPKDHTWCGLEVELVDDLGDGAWQAWSDDRANMIFLSAGEFESLEG